MAIEELRLELVEVGGQLEGIQEKESVVKEGSMSRPSDGRPSEYCVALPGSGFESVRFTEQHQVGYVQSRGRQQSVNLATIDPYK